MPIFFNCLITSFWLNLIGVALVSFTVTILDIYYIGLNAKERIKVRSLILQKIPFFNTGNYMEGKDGTC